MSSEDKTQPRKLKFKITTKGIRDGSEDNTNILKIKASKQAAEMSLDDQRGKKRKMDRAPEMSRDGQRGKKWKMDNNLKLQCGNILKELMNHPAGWIFSEPVDPVKLNIPDYFSIISKPMDLGTIKHKLEGNLYFASEEFAADVTLTFSNAITYNPPGHRVHELAKKLGGYFMRKWPSLEKKFKHANKNVEEASYMEKASQDTKQTIENNHQVSKPVGLNKASLRIKLGTCRSMSFEERQRFRMELVQMLSRKMTTNLRKVLQKFGLSGLNKEKLVSYIDSVDDETLKKLKREIKVLWDARDVNVKPSRDALNVHPSLRKTAPKEHCDRSGSASANHGQSIDSVETQCSSCVSLTCHCRLKSGPAQASASDISSERSSQHDSCGDSKFDCKVKCHLTLQTSSSVVDSDGPGVVLHEENSPHFSTPATAVAPADGWTSFNLQLSPKKAMRAAMLKRRFADTIFKATHQTLLDHGEKSDSLRIQQERERLEKEQQEEKARIEAEIKAAEAASCKRMEDDLKMRRQRERAAARMALEKMERTAEIDNNSSIMKDLELLLCSSPSELYSCEGRQGVKGVQCRHPLARLGLYLKENYLEEEDAVLSAEEGEILP